MTQTGKIILIVVIVILVILLLIYIHNHTSGFTVSHLEPEKHIKWSNPLITKEVIPSSLPDHREHAR